MKWNKLRPWKIKNKAQQKTKSQRKRSFICGLHEDQDSRALFAGAWWTSSTIPVVVGRRRIIAMSRAAQSIPTKMSHLHRGVYLQTATTEEREPQLSPPSQLSLFTFYTRFAATALFLFVFLPLLSPLSSLLFCFLITAVDTVITKRVR